MLVQYSIWSIVLYIPILSLVHLDKTQTPGLSSGAYDHHIMIQNGVVNTGLPEPKNSICNEFFVNDICSWFACLSYVKVTAGGFPHDLLHVSSP